MRVRGAVSAGQLQRRRLWIAAFAFFVLSSIGHVLAQAPEAKAAPCLASASAAHSAAPCSPCTSCATQNGGATAFVVQPPSSPAAEGKLKSLAPLLQTGLWVVLIGATLFGFRKQVAGFLDRAKAVDIGGVIKIETEPEISGGLSTAIPEATETRTRIE